MRTRSRVRLASSGMLLWVFVGPLSAQQVEGARSEVPPALAESRARLVAERYVTPPAEIAALVTAPRHLNVSLNRPSPDRTHFLEEESEGAPRAAAFAKPHYYFAGLQVDFKANRARSLTTRGASGLKLIEALTGRVIEIQIPDEATVSDPAWSPDGSQLAYIANFDDASQLYVADVATGKSRQLTRTPLLATLMTSVEWSTDGRSVLAVLLPENRGSEPAAPAVATGPEVRLWVDGVKSAERNWFSLLETPHDKAMMEYYVTGQLALIDVKSRSVRPIGKPAMIKSVDPSPDGRYFRVTTMLKPFSYVVPMNDFGEIEEIWDVDGTVLGMVTKEELRVGNDTTRGFGRSPSTEGKRMVAWMPAGEGLSYVERVPSARQDADSADSADSSGARGGRGGRNQRPDRLVQWLPPFGPGDTKVLYQHQGPISDLVFSADEAMIFVASTRNGVGEIVGLRLANPATKYPIVRMRGYTPSFTGEGRGRGRNFRRGGSPDDSLAFYTNPGAMMVTRGPRGGAVAMISSDSAVFLEGVQYAPKYLEQAPRPFIDKATIRTSAKTRIFQSAADVYESPGVPLDDDLSRMIVTRESPTQVPDAYLKDLRSGAVTQLTHNVDYSPTFTSAVRKRVFVTRADGGRFLVDVTLPAGYVAGTRLPAMFWFYPREYTGQADYEWTLRSENINAFPNAGPRTIEYLVAQGYAVANFNPPIIGESGRMNDHYVSDLRMNLYAVIDELDRQGFIDRTKLAIGGHSYGAFSTANAMVHTPYFKAGIAGDGMYNRTLTPNGFQSERRDLWNGQRVYIDVSPMLEIDKMQGALLMYHGMEDQNVGTTLISSIRMMQALRAYGKTASLYMYPYEDHGPATRETVLDLWGRWTAWLDIYVKHAGEAKPKAEPVTTTSEVGTPGR